MNRFSPASAALLGAALLVLAPTGSSAGEAAPTTKPAPAARPLSPMMVEIEAALSSADRSVAELATRLAAARSRTEAHAIQRDIERAKVGAEVSVLRIQAAYARREGRPEVAARLEAEAEQLQRPRARALPAQVVPPSDKR